MPSTGLPAHQDEVEVDDEDEALGARVAPMALAEAGGEEEEDDDDEVNIEGDDPWKKLGRGAKPPLGASSVDGPPT